MLTLQPKLWQNLTLKTKILTTLILNFDFKTLNFDLK